MTFSQQEASPFEGEPFELFRFSRGLSNFNYTSADEDLTISGVVYQSIPIERERIGVSQDLSKANLRMKIEGTQLIPQLYVSGSPSQVISVTIFAGHEQDPDDEIVTIWKGRVTSVKFILNTATIDAESIVTSMKRNGLRRRYQRGCPHRLYGSSTCRASPNAFRVDASVSSVIGNVVNGVAFGTVPSGRLTGGFLEWDNGPFTERRWITEHVGTQVTLRLPIPDLAAGANVRAFFGCDRTLNTCVTVFNNVVNYGGQPWIPEANPFAENVF